MSKKPNAFNKIINLLQAIHKLFPNQPLSNHLSTALSDYGKIEDLWGMSDKEILFALEKYQATLELDFSSPAHNDELERIIEEGKNIDKIDLYGDQDEEDSLWQ